MEVRDNATREVYRMRSSKERKRFLKQELKEYEKRMPMTQDERRELREWINAGYSVHENTCCAVDDGNKPIDFLDIYREEEALRKATAGMESEEANTGIRSGRLMCHIFVSFTVGFYFLFDHK